MYSSQEWSTLQQIAIPEGLCLSCQALYSLCLHVCAGHGFSTVTPAQFQSASKKILCFHDGLSGSRPGHFQQIRVPMPSQCRLSCLSSALLKVIGLETKVLTVRERNFHAYPFDSFVPSRGSRIARQAKDFNILSQISEEKAMTRTSFEIQFSLFEKHLIQWFLQP